MWSSTFEPGLRHSSLTRKMTISGLYNLGQNKKINSHPQINAWWIRAQTKTRLFFHHWNGGKEGGGSNEFILNWPRMKVWGWRHNISDHGSQEGAKAPSMAKDHDSSHASWLLMAPNDLGTRIHGQDRLRYRFTAHPRSWFYRQDFSKSAYSSFYHWKNSF